MRSISDVFVDFQATLTTPHITIADIVEALHERGFGFLLLIFAAPMALPIPVPPGINIVLASPLVLLTAQQALGHHTVWLPKNLKAKSIKRDKFNKMMNTLIPWMQKLEALFKPRLEFATQDLSAHIIGFLGLIMALTVCIPVPLTNSIPSLGIALMAIGVIMRDGLAVLAGVIVGTVWIGILALAITVFGAEGIDFVKDSIKSLMEV